MSSYLAIIPPSYVVADGLKFSAGGALFGVALGGVSEALGDWLVDKAGIEQNSELIHQGANVVIRLSVSTVAFLLADRMLSSVGNRNSDPTDGLFFHGAFLFGQRPLVKAFADLSGSISAQVSEWTGMKCCSSCAGGGQCSGK
jgi:hypothetical protein